MIPITSAGDKTIKALLQAIADDKSLADRLKVLSDAEQNAAQAAAKLTKAQDIDAALKRAKTLEQSALQKQEIAESQAKELIAKTKQETDAIVSNAQAHAQKIIQDAEAFAQSIQQQLIDAHEQTRHAEEKMARAIDATNEAKEIAAKAERAITDADTARREYESKLSKLQSFTKSL